MTETGKVNTLRVVKILDFGAYLDGGEQGEILLPIKQVPEGTKPDDELDVFIYNDSEDRIIANTELPYAMVGDFAFLKVVAAERVGAFLDWGLMKDLLVPFKEQNKKMEEGRWYVVRVYLDEETDRIAASARLDKFLDLRPPEYKSGEAVNIMIHSKTDMGYKVIINDAHWGMLYNNEIFKPVKVGDRMPAFIKKIREDYKIDVYLNKTGFGQIDKISQDILSIMKENGNFIPVTDKSKPEVIYSIFGISKKSFKKAIGGLYKKRLINIEDKGIRLIDKKHK